MPLRSILPQLGFHYQAKSRLNTSKTMVEIRNGIRHALSSPHIYDLFQSLVGAYAWRRAVINRYLCGVLPAKGLIIDIGCGTSQILNYLPPEAEYIGFDRNPKYIKHAYSRYSHKNGQFFCEEFSPTFDLKGRRADAVLAFGLIHHLDDISSIHLFKNAKSILRENGFLLTLDPVYTNAQSISARYIISKDRGTAVRSEVDYKALACQAFDLVEVYVDLNPLRIPYTGIVMKCKNSVL